MKKRWLYWLNGTIISLVVIATVVLAVVFSVNTHKINYYDCGVQDKTAFSGTFEAGAPKKHRNGTETFLVSPVKAGYNFDGWYFSYDGKGNRVIKLAADAKYDGKINVYAKWSAQTYIIRYKDMSVGGEDKEFSGEHESTYPTTHIYGTETVLDTPTKTGYTFMGYYTQNSTAGGKVTSLSATGYTADITLYALWVSALDAPTGLAFDKDAMTLSWNAVNNAVGYNVFDRGEKLNSTPIAGTSFTVGTRPVGTCRFTVVAVSVNTTETMDFNSAPSEEVTYIVEPEEGTYTNKIDVSADGKTALGFYDKNSGTLTILGEGRVDESIIDKINAIGEDEAKNITTIDLSNSAITTIDKDTFGKFTGITNIQSGSSVKTIGSGAFYMCDTLETVDLPDGIIYIGDRAFRGCTNLSEINLPDTVTSIGREAFYNCTKLGEIVIPGSVKKIPTEAFYGCTWLKSVIMEDGVEEIGYSAFRDCTGLTNVVFPQTLTRIEERAFNCAGDSANPSINVVLSDNLIILGESAFESAGIKEVFIGNGLTDLKAYTFRSSGITKFTATGLNVIYDSVFEGCEALKEVNLPSTLDRFGNSVFNWCSSLESFTVPEGVTELSDGLFGSCYGLTNIVLPNNLTKIKSTALSSCGFSEINIPESVVEIGMDAFHGCSNLQSIKLPNELKVLEGGVLSECAQLRTVELPTSLVEIGNYAFGNDSSLEEINLHGNNNLMRIGDNAFINCSSLKKLDIGGCSNVVFNEMVIEGCDAIEELDFSNTGFSFNGDGKFNLPSLTKINLSGCSGITEIPEFAFVYCTKLQVVDFSNCENLIKISDYAFSVYVEYPPLSGRPYCENLVSVDFSGCISLTSIGGAAFENCQKLVYASFENCNSLTTIYAEAFYMCYGLTDILLPNTIVSFGGSYSAPFSDCPALNKEGNLENGLQYITACDGVTKYLINCKDRSITTANINPNTRIIAVGALRSCTKLTDIVIPNSVIIIGIQTFDSCTNLANITVYGNIEHIGENAFSFTAYFKNDSNWQDDMLYLTANDGVTKYLISCKTTKSGDVEIDAGTKIIAPSAFIWCDKITKIVIPDTVIEIGINAFSGCSALTTVIIDSEKIANSLTGQYGCGYLINNATTIYIKQGLDVSSSTYLLNNFTKQETSDRAGYDKYVLN